MLERLSERFDEASRLGSPKCTILLDGRPFFSGYADRFRLMNSMHLSKVHAPRDRFDLKINKSRLYSGKRSGI